MRWRDGTLVRNATLDEIKENGWLKRKACENCVKKLKENRVFLIVSRE